MSVRDASLEEHLSAFRRGAVDLIEEPELERARRDDAGLRIKFGMDASSPDLHVGHAVVLRKLRDLQDLGHTVVLLMGDVTAMVGDPSGRNEARPQLSRAAVEANLATYVDQARIVLDMQRVELRRNSEWFDRMSFEDVLRLTSRMTVAQMIQRDTFKKRMAADEPIGVHEFLYPLMQGWDSVELRADVELGGTDQLFNLIRGRDFQREEGQEPQIVLTTPLIEGLDGRKMSKSYGNAIGLTEPPDEVFGKTMSLADDRMRLWFELLTRVPEPEIESLLGGHPREAKARLAAELVTFLHGPDAAHDARAAFDRQFREKQLPDDIPERVYEGSWPVPLFVLVRDVGLASSSSDGRRKIQGGGVATNQVVQTDPRFMVEQPEDELLLRVGRRFVRVVSKPG